MMIYIKNMVCLRCKMAVQSVLEGLQIDYTSIELGRVNLPTALLPEQQDKLAEGLQHYRLELMENKKQILTEQIKVTIMELFAAPGQEMLLKLSEHLCNQFPYDYTYLSNIFSETEGTTIEKYYISQNPFAPESIREVPKKDVARTSISDAPSIMFPRLINRLNPDELKDLMAYLMAGGNKNAPVFKN